MGCAARCPTGSPAPIINFSGILVAWLYHAGARRATMAEFEKCADVGQLAPGTCRMVNVAGRDLALFNVDGSVHCLDNTCLHRGGPLGEGYLDGAVVTCPWHGWQYNVRTGELLIDPSVKIATYPVRLEGTAIEVEVRNDE